MPATTQQQLSEERRLAEQVYDRMIRPALRPDDDGKYVAVAFELDDYEVDHDDFAATERLLARHPGAKLWLMRTGPSAAYRVRALVQDIRS